MSPCWQVSPQHVHCVKSQTLEEIDQHLGILKLASCTYQGSCFQGMRLPTAKGSPRSLAGLCEATWMFNTVFQVQSAERVQLRCVRSRTRGAPLPRRHQTCDFGEHATSAPAELGGEIHKVSRNRARTQVFLQARKLHVYGKGTSGAFWAHRAKAGRVRAAAGGPGPPARPAGGGAGSRDAGGSGQACVYELSSVYLLLYAFLFAYLLVFSQAAAGRLWQPTRWNGSQGALTRVCARSCGAQLPLWPQGVSGFGLLQSSSSRRSSEWAGLRQRCTCCGARGTWTRPLFENPKRRIETVLFRAKR